MSDFEQETKSPGCDPGAILTDRIEARGPLSDLKPLAVSSTRLARPPLRATGGLGESEQPLEQAGLADEAERDLSALVGLREHRGAGLDQDVPAGELRAFLGHIHISDAAVGGLDVGFIDGQNLGGEA